MPSDLFPPIKYIWAKQPSPGGVDPNRDWRLVRDAYNNALKIIHYFRAIEDQVRELFPHRADAIALAGAVIRILYEQHGGEHPFNLLFDWDLWDFRGILSRQDSLAMVRVWRRWSKPQIEQDPDHCTP